MIQLNKIAEVIENGLDALSDKEFQIFTDMGEFKKSYRADNSNDITRYINGVLEGMQPTILPMKNLEVITQSFRVTFVLDIDLLNKDAKGNFIEVKTIRALLEKYITQANGRPYIIVDEDSTSFEITPSFSGVTVGIASQMSPIGNILPMYLDFSCVFVESGINANNVQFIVNGENMLFQTYSVTRKREAETNMVANTKSSKSLAQSNGISIHLEMPLLNTTESKNIEEDVWSGGQNEAVCVERIRGTNYHAYIMIIGDNSETGEIGQNIGQTINFVEGKQNKLNYTASTSKGWGTKTITVQEAGIGVFTDLSDIGSNANTWVAFWDEGQVQKQYTNHNESVTFSVAGTHTARVYYYNDPNIE